jgi:hypothetical protein
MSLLQAPSAQAILDDLNRAARDFLARIHSDDGSEDLALARMRSRARDLHAVLWAACKAGSPVMLYCAAHRGDPHVVVTMGPLQPDGITFRYSCRADAGELDRWCTLISVRMIRFCGNAVHCGGPNIETRKRSRSSRCAAVNSH